MDFIGVISEFTMFEELSRTSEEMSKLKIHKETYMYSELLYNCFSIKLETHLCTRYL